MLQEWRANVEGDTLKCGFAPDFIKMEELAAELDAMAEAAAKGDSSAAMDAFFKDLEFGTAGLRGIIGAGTNRMNVYTVARATQGLADYLNAHFENPSVAIARDSRHKGELFVDTAASVLAANGIKSYIYPRVEPTPALSFAVRDLGCSAGINMTASHNPAAYNGYKVYGPDGCQITSEAATGDLGAHRGAGLLRRRRGSVRQDGGFPEGRIRRHHLLDWRGCHPAFHRGCA